MGSSNSSRLRWYLQHLSRFHPILPLNIFIVKENNMKELWMDDIGTIALEATELIQNRLKEYNIELKTPQEDEFYVPIFNALEKYSNCNYRHEN
jgi:hypothetical protein